MGRIIRCLSAVLLVLACSGVAFGEELSSATVQSCTIQRTDATQTALSQWGDNVVITSVLTRGQALETLFSNNVQLSDLVAQWKQNFETTPPAVADAQEIKAALNVLVRAFASDRRLNWSAQDVLIGAWADLPGSPIYKKKIRGAFEILKADGLMCLSFLNRSEEEEAPQALVTAMVNVLDNPTLSMLTHFDLYTTGSAPDQYSDSDLDLLIYAMDEVQLIRTEQPDRSTQVTTITAPVASSASGLGASSGTFGVAAASGSYFCCSRTTRSCVGNSTGGKCSICGSTCCLGSTWCP